MKQGDLVAARAGRWAGLWSLERASSYTKYTHGVIVEIVEVRNDLLARVLWQNGIQNEQILQDFVYYYEVVNGE